MSIVRALTLSLLLALATTLACAQTDKYLTDLKVLFEKDPAAGFVQAERLFEVPKKAGDLEGMLAILAIVRDWSLMCTYPAPCLAMAEAALPIALANGNWAAVGDIRWAQAEAVDYRGLLRREIVTQMATDAYAKAGKEPPEFTQWKAASAPYNPGQRDLHTVVMASLSTLPPEIRLTAQNLLDASERADDNQASGLMLDLANAVSDAPPSVRSRVAEFVAYDMFLPGSERLLPHLRRWISDADGGNPWDWERALNSLLLGCELGWSGRRDEFLESYSWALQNARGSGRPTDLYYALGLLTKSVRLHEPEIVDGSVRLLLDLPSRADATPQRWQMAVLLVHPRMAPELRQRLVQEYLQYLDWALRTVTRFADERIFGFSKWQIAETAPASERATWCLETAYQILNYAPNFPTAASRGRAATEAAAYFTKADRADLASQAQELAQSFAADDPKLRVQVALAAAQSAARDDKWPEVVKGLLGAVESAPESPDLVQALVLLGQAQQKLGQAEARASLERAGRVLGRLNLPAGEKANIYMTLASCSVDNAQKVAYLQAGQAAAQAGGVDFLADKFTEQLATTALASGDLPAAEKALLQQISRLEAKREQLAFDRLLRQQWFADNLGPYRKLLRVAVLENKAPLALWVGERMRGRALQDQLAWQKVDLGVRLPQKVRARLEGLRKARRETYALLQQVMGGRAMTDATRGSYMPIRGAYMPIRGGLEGDKPATEADVKQLRARIDSLAREEAALASVIRENVPAYADACAVKTPTGSELAATVAKQPDLAVLEYTLGEDGLVTVALGPGQAAQVVSIAVKGEDLWQQIGQFRQLIWERKPEAAEAAAKLYALLIKPLEGSLTGAKRLWVIGDGALQSVPFAALRDANGQYLGQRVAVAMTPSLSLAFADFGKRVPGTGALVFAAPDTGATPLAEADDKRGSYMPIRGMYMPVRGSYMPIRGEGVSSALTMMANVPLPGAKAEGEALAAKLPNAKLLTGKEATRTKLLNQGGQCDLLHIATHGYADPETPEFSGLLVAGEGTEPHDVLTAQEVYMWGLKARLVTLSACQTALGQTVEGEGVLGLTRAFIYAGAQDVLCSLWPVADESTKALMLAFYDKLQPGVPVETALQQAQLTLLQTEATKEPFYWAGFTAVRGPE